MASSTALSWAVRPPLFQQTHEQLFPRAAEDPVDQVAEDAPRDVFKTSRRAVLEGPLGVGLLQKAFFGEDADQRGHGGVGQVPARGGQLVADFRHGRFTAAPKDVHHLQLSLGEFLGGGSRHEVAPDIWFLRFGFIVAHPPGVSRAVLRKNRGDRPCAPAGLPRGAWWGYHVGHETSPRVAHSASRRSGHGSALLDQPAAAPGERRHLSRGYVFTNPAGSTPWSEDDDDAKAGGPGRDGLGGIGDCLDRRVSCFRRGEPDRRPCRREVRGGGRRRRRQGHRAVRRRGASTVRRTTV